MTNVYMTHDGGADTWDVSTDPAITFAHTNELNARRGRAAVRGSRG